MPDPYPPPDHVAATDRLLTLVTPDEDDDEGTPQGDEDQSCGDDDED